MLCFNLDMRIHLDNLKTTVCIALKKITILNLFFDFVDLSLYI